MAYYIYTTITKGPDFKHVLSPALNSPINREPHCTSPPTDHTLWNSSENQEDHKKKLRAHLVITSPGTPLCFILGNYKSSPSLLFAFYLFEQTFLPANLQA